MAADPHDAPVAVEVAAGVAQITMVDEARRNVLGPAMVAGLLGALSGACADPVVRAVVLTNSGTVFCAGADLSARAEGEAPGAAGLDELLAAIADAPKPVVGRVDGHAFGGGVGLAAACDISIARDDALLGFTEVRVGVAPAVISVVCLPKMRPGDAMEMFLRGSRFPATRAAEVGLLNRAVAADALDGAVAEVLDDIRLGGPTALAEAKRLVRDVPGMGRDDAFRLTARRSAELFAGEEAAEGMAAFRQKRRPAWAPPE